MAKVMESPGIGAALRRAHDLASLAAGTLSWGWALERLPIRIYTCDADGHLVQYNWRAAELWGNLQASTGNIGSADATRRPPPMASRLRLLELP